MTSTFEFSLTNGKRIAKLITNKKKDDKYIYLYNPKFKSSMECKNTIKCKCSGNGKCYTLEYHENATETFKKLIAPPNTRFMIAPSNIPETVTNLFITGPQGCGKSVMVKECTKVFKELNKKIPVILISEAREDKNIDDVINKRVTPEQIRDDDIKFSDFEDMSKEYGGLYIIFDDIDSIDDSKKNGYLRHTVYTLLNALINNSRKHNINIVFTSHKVLEATKTGVMIDSCSSWIFFSSSITLPQVESCAINKFGLTQPQFKKLKEIAEKGDTYWLSINRTIPMTIITEHEIMKVNDLVDED